METPLSPVKHPKRALIAGAVGNFIEWYEFAIYGFLATIIAHNFFQLQGESALSGLILTWASFAIAFFFRPLGALVFGRLGDRLGRKPVLITVLILMTLATTAIGLIPTYATAGILAPVLLTALRILQGLFAGGEYGGAVALMTEFAPRGQRGRYGAWQSLTVAFGLVALWLRLAITETPDFVRQQQQRVRAAPRQTIKIIFLAIARVMLWSSAGYTCLVIMPGYLQSALHTGMNQALLIAVIANVGFALTIIPAGIVSDRVGRRRVMVSASVLLLLMAMPLLKIVQADGVSLLLKALVVLIAGGLVGLLAGPGPAMLSEMFPTTVRYTGLGVAYALSNAVFSGCAGLIITGLIKQTGNLDIPAWYMMATALVSIPALMTLNKDDHTRELT
ncbi:MFS transporter [Pantoea stewartii]|uniref:Major facilitator superfamily (MFS) transporter n=1 Tax=Pantoea stewartii subsp. stewartii DC283 TaxID=660596 RepID=H3RE61_PANSE|nr:MFS transporter [Pantoea stewartii]ARF49858.1 metabolite-proton symporter [Pantoea stewartii subsp. stewartii DC283]EHU00404.1 major facilitator superfamily (MFS) transporter [Pantoea stewartii subsp. stewartii DC283]KAB0546334.1 MHS family MFS transporter [Pantoea stewartii subsp. stewartii]